MAAPARVPRQSQHSPTHGLAVFRAFFTATTAMVLFLAAGSGTVCLGMPSSVPSTALENNSLLPPLAGNASIRALSGQVSFRTKTRHGVRGLLPKPLKFPRFWGKKGQDEALDTAKRFLHVTLDALVLEVEGEEECLSVSRGPESAAGGARLTVVRRNDAGIDRGSPGYVTTIPVDGLFGVYDFLSGPFVAVVRKSKLRYANRELGVEFRQVSKVSLIPVLATPRALGEGQAREEARLLALLSLAFRSHQFYFSHAHDVTHTLQRLGVSASQPAQLPNTAARGSRSKHNRRRKRAFGVAASATAGAPTAVADSPRVGAEAALVGGRKVESNSSCSTSSQERGRERRGWHGGRKPNATRDKESAIKSPPTMKNPDAMSTSSPSSPPTRPPPDTRFFWNLGVLGPLLELREGLAAEDATANSDLLMGKGVGAGEVKVAAMPKPVRARGGLKPFGVGGRRAGEGGGGGVLEAIEGPTPVKGPKAVAAVDRWLTPVMSGFLQVERGCRVGDKGFDVLFVSRRSRLRQGTRFTRRGIDDSGNVANFVETEQSLLHDDNSVTSHVQIRGSIPVLWSSPTNLRYHPKVHIDPDEEASLRALRQHSQSLISLYGSGGGGVLFVNLVDKKKEQGALGETFDSALKAVAAGAGQHGTASHEAQLGDKNNVNGMVASKSRSEGGEHPNASVVEAGQGGGARTTEGEEAEGPPTGPTWARKHGGGSEEEKEVDLAGSLRHVWFDFHHECRNMHWENLDKLLAIVDREFGEQGFYHAGPGGETLSVQDGVVRTNCMDCLDRTNVVQSLLARRSMLVQLQAVGVEVPDPEGGNSMALALTLDMLEMPAEELERRFRDIWGNNADEISMLYAGTPALKGDFTRTGQRTKLGLLQDGTNSAIRYLVNNFQDHRRQEAVDLMLGVHRRAVDSNGNPLREGVKEPLDLDLWTTLLPTSSSQIGDGTSDTEMTVESLATTTKPPSSKSPSNADESRSSSDGSSCLDGELGIDVRLEDGNTERPRRGGGGGQASGGVATGRQQAGAGAQDGLGPGIDTARGVGGGVASGGARAGVVVETVTGAALTELRMAGPYSALALTALALMVIRGGDILAFGLGSGAGVLVRAETLALLVGLASIPLVLSLLEER